MPLKKYYNWIEPHMGDKAESTVSHMNCFLCLNGNPSVCPKHPYFQWSKPFLRLGIVVRHTGDFCVDMASPSVKAQPLQSFTSYNRHR